MTNTALSQPLIRRLVPVSQPVLRTLLHVTIGVALITLLAQVRIVIGLSTHHRVDAGRTAGRGCLRRYLRQRDAGNLPAHRRARLTRVSGGGVGLGVHAGRHGRLPARLFASGGGRRLLSAAGLGQALRLDRARHADWQRHHLYSRDYYGSTNSPPTGRRRSSGA